MKTTAALLSFSALILNVGCAGPMGPPLGLGPDWDALVGVAIVGLIAAIMYRSVRKLISTQRQKNNPRFANERRTRALHSRQNQSGRV